MPKKVIPGAMAVDDKKDARVDETLMDPSIYEITQDSTFKIEFTITQKSGRWVTCDPDTRDKDAEDHWVEFRMWSFEEEVMLRKEATKYDATKRMHLVDHDHLNRLKVQRLLKDWSFEAKSQRLKLLHVNGVLSDESYDMFRKLHPNISRHIVEKMNDVLEFNG